MPNIRIHEEIAYLYTRKYKEYDNSYFYLGVLAPDTPNLYGFAPKEQRWEAHQRNKDLDIWENKIKKFYIDNKNIYNRYFIYGYLFHVITDIAYDKYFYLKVRENIIKDNIPIENAHQVMIKDMDYYGSNFKEFVNIKKQLLDITEYYEILNIKKEQLKEWTQLNIKNIKKKESKYLTKELINSLELKVEQMLKNMK